MTDPSTGRVTDDERLTGPQKVQDASTDTLTPRRIGELFGLTTALAVVLYVVRELLFGGRKKTKSELFTEAASAKALAAKAKAEAALAKSEPSRKAAKKAAQKAADRAAKQAGPVAKEAGEKARKAAEQAAKTAVPLAVAGAGAVAATAGKVGTEVASKAAGLGAGVVTLAGEIGDEVGDTVHGVQKKVRKTKRRLFVLVCLAIGYVLGARAGRERYDQIVAQAQKLAGRPEVQQAREKVAEKVDQAGGSSEGSPTTV